MKKLFRVSCSGNGYSITTNDNIYVVAESFEEASTKALDKMRALQYDKVDGYVSDIKLIADEDESNKILLII